jgi:hypothetical protein
VRRCTILNSGGTDKPAIQSWGRGSVFEDNVITGSAYDSLHIQGQQNIARRNVISKTGRTTPTLGDDCIQMLGASDDGLIEYNTLDKRQYGVWKQALVAKGDRTIVRFNTLLGPSDGAGLLTADGGTGMEIYGNYVEGNDGIYLLNATGPHTVYGNVIKGTDSSLTQGESTGIDHFSSPLRDHKIFNNTVIGHRRGIYAQGVTVQNNIVVNCGGTGIDTGTGATLESYNCSFGNGTNFSGTPGTGSIQTDPVLRANYMPMAAAVRNAFPSSIGLLDFYGSAFLDTMGAVQYYPPDNTFLTPRIIATFGHQQKRNRYIKKIAVREFDL